MKPSMINYKALVAAIATVAAIVIICWTSYISGWFLVAWCLVGIGLCVYGAVDEDMKKKGRW